MDDAGTAKYVGEQKDRFGNSLSLFNVDWRGHPSHGSTVGANTLRQLFISVPLYKKEERLSTINSNAQKWVVALKSGAFQQGYRVLHCTEGNRFDCLGVACEVYMKETGRSLYSYFLDGREYYANEDDRLPKEVQTWLGLWTPIGLFRDTDGEWVSLVWLNDEHIPFSELATLIESKPNKLFEEGK